MYVQLSRVYICERKSSRLAYARLLDRLSLVRHAEFHGEPEIFILTGEYHFSCMYKGYFYKVSGCL